MSPVGRPRVSPRSSAGDPREEILAAAADLFCTAGYTATSTRAIAQAVGLRQASLFHYYSRKEAILAELLDRTLRPALDLTRRLGEAQLGAEAALWVLVERDVTNLCSGPHNLGALQLLPEAHASQFAWFWSRRQQLIAFYHLQIHAGADAGLFPFGALPYAPDLVFGLVESVITASPAVRADRDIPASVADAALRILGVPLVRLRRAHRNGVHFSEHDQPFSALGTAEGNGQSVGCPEYKTT